LTRRTRLDTSDKTIRKIVNKRLKLQNGSPGAGSHSLRFTYLILTLLVVFNGAVLLSNSRVRSLLAPSTPAKNPPRVESTKIQAPKPAATSTPAAAQPAKKATPTTQSTPEVAQSTKSGLKNWPKRWEFRNHAFVPKRICRWRWMLPLFWVKITSN